MNNQLNEGTKALIRSNLTHAWNLLYGRRLDKDTKDKIAHAMQTVIEMVDKADTATDTPTARELRKVVNTLSHIEADEKDRIRKANLAIASMVCDDLRKDIEDWEANQ